MTIEEIRASCEEPKERGCRNIELCRMLCRIDETFVYHIDRDVLNHSPERSALENIDEILNGEVMIETTNRSQGTEWYNSYPFGAETDNIYSRFLGVCRGKTRLDAVLKEAIRHIDNVEKFCMHHQEKTTVILTDKWDAKIFAKYEKAFVRYVCKYNNFPIFFLVTDYGYTQIPFLANDRDKARELLLDEDVDRNEAVRLFNDLPVEYIEQGSVFNVGHRSEYTFYFKERVWELDRVYTENGMLSGTIPDRAVKQFFKDVLWIANAGDKELYANRSFDSTSYALNIFGKKLCWDVSATDANGDPRFIKLSKAINKLIESLEPRQDNM